MSLPGITDIPDVKKLLEKLLGDRSGMTLKFAVVARGPRDGELALSKIEKLKKKDVVAEAEKIAKTESGGKPVKLDVMVGECRLLTPGGTVLLVQSHGKAPAKAVSCLEYLITTKPFHTVGFTAIQLEEVDENQVPTVESSSTEPSPTAEPTGGVDETAKLKSRLTELVKKAAPFAAMIGTEVKRLVDEATRAAQADPPDMARANQSADRLEQKIERTAAAQLEWTKRNDALAPRVKKVLAEKLGDFAEVGGLYKEAQSAAATDFGEGLELLDACDTMIAMALVPPLARLDRDSWDVALDAWETAVETVNRQLERLQAELRSSSDKDLQRIAEFGINAVTGDFRVPLSAALLELQANPEEVAGKTVGDAIALIHDFQAHLAADPRVAACDQNPFGVKVTIRAAYIPALERLGQALRKAQAA